jgi:hypothetical protein
MKVLRIPVTPQDVPPAPLFEFAISRSKKALEMGAAPYRFLEAKQRRKYPNKSLKINSQKGTSQEVIEDKARSKKRC